MMKWLMMAVLASVAWQDAVPYKPGDEFELKLDFQFKDRPRSDPNKVELDKGQREIDRRSSGPLPYLFLNFRVLKQQSKEIRVRVLENGDKVVHNKKVDTNAVLKLELGFTDDIKDRVGPYEFTIFLLDEEKQPVSRVVIYFEKDGTYRVNDQVRGKI